MEQEGSADCLPRSWRQQCCRQSSTGSLNTAQAVLTGRLCPQSAWLSIGQPKLPHLLHSTTDLSPVWSCHLPVEITLPRRSSIYVRNVPYWASIATKWSKMTSRTPIPIDRIPETRTPIACWIWGIWYRWGMRRWWKIGGRPEQLWSGYDELWEANCPVRCYREGGSLQGFCCECLFFQSWMLWMKCLATYVNSQVPVGYDVTLRQAMLKCHVT